MKAILSDQTSIYLQISQIMENDILRGIYLEEEQVPSTNDLARQYSINPATAAKGVNILVDAGILYKKRGIGMFVSDGAMKKIRESRKKVFYQEYVTSLVKEAKSLSITLAELAEMIRKASTETV